MNSSIKTGLNSDGMQRANRNLILGILLEKKSVSRIELAKMTNLKRATITNIINGFLEMGIVRETGYQVEDNGRKVEKLVLYAPDSVVLSARLTREFFLASAFSLSGEQLCSRRHAIVKNSTIREIMQGVTDDIDAVLAQVGKSNVIGLSVGLPGPYIRGKRNVTIVTEFEQLSHVDIQRELEERYQFLTVTEHDSKLSALAEWRNLDHKTREGENSLIAIQSIGIGIGSGMITNDRIFHGAVGVAGEIGHMGININGSASSGASARGMYETYASTGSVRKYVLERLYEFPDTVLDENSDYSAIKRAYYDGDKLAECAMDKMAWHLSYGLANIIFVMNPSRIVLCEDYPNCQRFIDKVHSFLSQMVYSELLDATTIQYTNLTLDSTVWGGYFLVLDKLIKSDRLLSAIAGA